jgi:hypothetical protein
LSRKQEALDSAPSTAKQREEGKGGERGREREGREKQK